MSCRGLLTSPQIRHYSCVLFPGQGAQYVGMTSKLQTHRAVQSLFKQANDILGCDLQSLCLRGPESVLRRTEYCQPAIVVSSLAAAKVNNLYQDCQAVAGFSVGEMAALIFTGAISFEAGLQLVAARARAMQSASEVTPSSLIRVIGLSNKETADMCEEVKVKDLGDASIAIKLFTKGHVIACNGRAVDVVLDKIRAAGGMAEVLKLSGAFHSSYMSPAMEGFSQAVSNAPLSLPHLPVYSNMTGKAFTSVDEMRQLITKQLTHSVLWHELIINIREDYPNCTFMECGPGRQLNFLLRKIDTKIVCTNYSV